MQPGSIVFMTNSPEQTEQLGKELGQLLESGDLITLSGELGGGKTCFVRGIVAGSSPSALDMVASPTFAILNEYPGGIPIYHYDCYRLRGSDDAIELGLEEHLLGTGICLVEWPDRIRDLLPPERLDIIFEYCGDSIRQISIIPLGTRGAELVKKLESIDNHGKKELV